jgi:heme/copper-type cytochrome/quinol oxidase subunit 4
MKIQDIIFLVVFLILLFKRDSKWTSAAGIICLVLAIPLFALWIFFTAQHLVWYSAGFFLLSIILLYNRK